VSYDRQRGPLVTAQEMQNIIVTSRTLLKMIDRRMKKNDEIGRELIDNTAGKDTTFFSFFPSTLTQFLYICWFSFLLVPCLFSHFYLSLFFKVQLETLSSMISLNSLDGICKIPRCYQYVGGGGEKSFFLMCRTCRNFYAALSTLITQTSQCIYDSYI
jgi:hypothetical protein